MRYYLYIKSHCELPDYESETEANSKEEAVNLFLKDLGKYGWERNEIEEKVASEHDIFHTPEEMIDIGDNEHSVYKCIKCDELEEQEKNGWVKILEDSLINSIKHNNNKI